MDAWLLSDGNYAESPTRRAKKKKRRSPRAIWERYESGRRDPRTEKKKKIDSGINLIRRGAEGKGG